MKRVAAILLVVALAGCATAPARVTAPGSDPVAELLAHPDARKVARDYPKFFGAALTKVAELKHDLTVEANK